MLRVKTSATCVSKCISRYYSTVKKPDQQESIRNIGILAHIDAGEKEFQRQINITDEWAIYRR